MKANLTGSASRRTPLLFLGCLALLRRSGALDAAAPAPRAPPWSGRSAPWSAPTSRVSATTAPAPPPQPHQPLALGRGQAGPTLGPVRLRAFDPLPQRGLGQIKIARHGADALAFIEDQARRLLLELSIEPPALAPRLGTVCHWSGHRIHLSEDVHQSGSSPRGLWTVDCGPWTVDCGPRTVDCGPSYCVEF